MRRPRNLRIKAETEGGDAKALGIDKHSGSDHHFVALLLALALDVCRRKRISDTDQLVFAGEFDTTLAQDNDGNDDDDECEASGSNIARSGEP